MSDVVNPHFPVGRQRDLPRRRPIKWWLVLVVGLVVLTGAAVIGYHWLKMRRANQFAATGDSLAQAGKLSDAAVQYRVALQLDPENYRGLSGAARLASRADRPEALELWQRVLKLSRATAKDRQDYADLLIKTNRLNLAQKTIDDLLKESPDTRTLQLAARYSRKTGDNVKAVEYARIAANRAPDDETARFQLAELLAQSSDSKEQSEARAILWELTKKPSPYKAAALEALARAPELTDDERSRLLQEFSALA